MNDIEKTLASTKERLKLSDSEKAFHRAEILKHMEKRVPTLSPFMPWVHRVRYVAALLVLVLLTGSGATYAAERSLPGDTLYAVKVKVADPVEHAFAFGPAKKAGLEVDLADRRLKEIAQVSVTGETDARGLALATASLFDNINSAQSHIHTLQEGQDIDAAFETATQLQATLDAHATILTTLQERDPARAPSLDTLVGTLTQESNETDTIVASTTEAIQAASPDALTEARDEQQDDTASSLSRIKEDVARALASFDTSDRADVNAALGSINEQIAQAEQKDAAGDATSAYLLYAEARQRIAELSTLIEADQTLGVDVLTATSTDEQ